MNGGVGVDSIQLRKFVKLVQMEKDDRVRDYRKSIFAKLRRERDKAEGKKVSGGGGFYDLFWADAKAHVLNNIDLITATEARIQADDKKSRLFPILLNGFSTWWNERRRWTNSPFREAPQLTASNVFREVQTNLKIENFLSVTDAVGDIYNVYPYWFEKPIMRDEHATLAFKCIEKAFPNVELDTFRILDVCRGVTFRVNRQAIDEFDESIIHRQLMKFKEEYDEQNEDIIASKR